MKRRTFITAGASALMMGIVRRAHSVPVRTDDRFTALELEIGGRLGVAALDTGSGASLGHRGGERFAMCSTFKWLLAAAVLAKVDQGELTLEHRLTYSGADLLPHSPVTTAHVAEGGLSIEKLCAAIVEESDNTAANVLLRLIGGPASLTQYLRHIGDRATRLDRWELELNTNLPGDPRDTTTPEAMLATMRKLMLDKALSTGSRDTLLRWLKQCRTGLHRLRAGLPAGWVVGDKTGHGDNGSTNDLAIIWPPERAPILIAAYLSESPATDKTLDAALARIASIVVAALS
jgi:beta-lactamase class A